jgi:RHS repeat-associated protein
MTGTGTIARDNPFRFSTKRTEDNTDLVLYEYRPYSPSLGRWPSRDPIREGGFNRAESPPTSRSIEGDLLPYAFV